MKFLCFVVLSGIAVNVVSGYPSARNPSSESEESLEQTVVVPLEAQRGAQQQQGGAAHVIIGGFGPPLDFGAPLVGGFGPQAFNDVPYGGYAGGLVPQPPAPSFFSAFNPFAGGADPALGGAGAPAGFLGGLESGLALMRRQLAALLNNVPGLGGAGPGMAPHDGNTTSTTKVIDGHRITINETVYGNGYDGSVFKVRVVDVHPEKSSEEGEDSTTVSPKGEAEDMGKQIDSSETTTQDSNSSGDAEDVTENDESSAEKISNDITQKSDEIDESTTKMSTQETTDKIQTNAIDQQENLDAVRFEGEPFVILQRDPESAISEQARPETWESLEHLNNGPEYEDILETNDVQLHDIPEIPVDLTNDIAVNDFLADLGATQDPSAELIEVFGDKAQSDYDTDDFRNKRRLRSLRSMPLK